MLSRSEAYAASATFKKKVEGKIRHPAICVVAGHFIHFLTRRAGYAEYVCRNCGHPFCFADPEPNRSVDLVNERDEHGDVVLPHAR